MREFKIENLTRAELEVFQSEHRATIAYFKAAAKKASQAWESLEDRRPWRREHADELARLAIQDLELCRRQLARSLQASARIMELDAEASARAREEAGS